MPAAAAKHVSPYEIRIDGSALDPKYKERLLEIKVRQSLRQPSSATIRISDPKAENMDSHPLQIGKKLQILLGSPEAQAPTKVFDGEIVALDPEFEKDGASIGVRAYDKSHRLNRAKKVRTFQQMSASNMVTKVLNEAGLSPRVTATQTVFEFFQQSDETVESRKAQVKLKGELTFHGVTNPIEVPVTLERVDAQHVSAESTFSISLEAYKVERPELLMVKVDDKMDIEMKLMLGAIRKGPEKELELAPGAHSPLVGATPAMRTAPMISAE